MNVGYLGQNMRKRVHDARTAARYVRLRAIWPSLSKQEAWGIACILEKWARLAEQRNT